MCMLKYRLTDVFHNVGGHELQDFDILVKSHHEEIDKLTVEKDKVQHEKDVNVPKLELLQEEVSIQSQCDSNNILMRLVHRATD